jgi:Rrf2 family transcriptional regulator, nitric oxide-sensitive transcriptional repressor
MTPVRRQSAKRLLCAADPVKLTTFTDYSLRVLMYLAIQPGQRTTIAQVASAFGISENHLVKVVHFLGRQGWLKNVRGKGGGLELAVPAAAVNLGEVVRQTEGEAIVVECFDANAPGCAIGSCCRLQGIFAEAVDAFKAVLDRHTLADLVTNRVELERILFHPRRPAGVAAEATA